VKDADPVIAEVEDARGAGGAEKPVK